MSSHPVADTLRPDGSRPAWLYDAALVVGFSLVVALSAQVAIPLPFTPVPVTLQTLAVLLAGCLLGSGRGALAVLAYIGEGAAGLPVFSGGRGALYTCWAPPVGTCWDSWQPHTWWVSWPSVVRCAPGRARS